MPKVFIKSKLKRKKVRIKAEPNGSLVQPKYHIYRLHKKKDDEYIYAYTGSTGFREVKRCLKQLQFMGL